MSLQSLCDRLRQQPFDLISVECATSLNGFFAGYGFSNASIKRPLESVKRQFSQSSELSACMLAYLNSTDSKSSFDIMLDSLEYALKQEVELVHQDIRSGPPLLDAILDSIDQNRLGFFLVEPSAACLFETLNGYWSGIAEFDPSEAQLQREDMKRFELWLRQEYDAPLARWYAILRVYGGSLSVLNAFGDLYRRFRS